MDLNELFHAHQLAVMKFGGGGAADSDHAARIALYAAQIRELRDADPDRPAQAIAGPVRIGLAADLAATSAAPPGKKAALEDWESEGGALAPPPDALPPGITMTMRPEYRVGRYTYSDRALALAELARQQRGRT